MSSPRAGGDSPDLSPNHRYLLYGLVLDTPYELVGLREVEGSAATVELSAAGAEALALARREIDDREWPCEEDDWFCHARLADGSDYLRWSGHFEFLVDPEGRRISYLEHDQASPEALQVYLLGQVLSFALLKRGIEPLHATAVLVDGAAVAFVGESGAGKSTLAASFLAAGYPLLTDDLLVLEQRDGSLFGFAGMPRIKLYPEAAEALLPGSGAGIEMNEWTPKRIIPLRVGQFCDSPARLSAIFLLSLAGGAAGEGARTERGERVGEAAPCPPTLERVSSRDAFLDLLENTYNPLVDDSRRLRRHFHQLAGWVESVPLVTLRGPRDLGRVGEMRDAILEFVAAGL